MFQRISTIISEEGDESSEEPVPKKKKKTVTYPFSEEDEDDLDDNPVTAALNANDDDLLPPSPGNRDDNEPQDIDDGDHPQDGEVEGDMDNDPKEQDLFDKDEVSAYLGHGI